MREAAEAGDPVAIAQYEEHLAYQRERNQKHRQKLKEAREASPEYISQLEEKERSVKRCSKLSVCEWSEPKRKTN